MSKMSFVICHVLEVVCRVREKRQAALLEGKQVGRLRAYPPPLLPLLVLLVLSHGSGLGHGVGPQRGTIRVEVKTHG